MSKLNKYGINFLKQKYEQMFTFNKKGAIIILTLIIRSEKYAEDLYVYRFKNILCFC